MKAPNSKHQASEKLQAEKEEARIRFLLSKRMIEVQISQAQWEYLNQLCRDQVDPAAMASTALFRGLQVIGDEIGIEWNPHLEGGAK